MTQKQVLTKQREVILTARHKSYISYLEKYPLYSTLMVLKEYEDKQFFEECAIIRDSILTHNTKEEVKNPLHLREYKGKAHQDMMYKLNLNVEDKLAIEKATLIKLNLPVK